MQRSDFDHSNENQMEAVQSRPMDNPTPTKKGEILSNELISLALPSV